MAGGSRYTKKGRMAERLRPRVFIVEIKLITHRISVGSISCPLRKTIGWADGNKILVSSSL
jgi:hypothetical protein